MTVITPASRRLDCKKRCTTGECVSERTVATSVLNCNSFSRRFALRCIARLVRLLYRVVAVRGCRDPAACTHLSLRVVLRSPISAAEAPLQGEASRQLEARHRTHVSAMALAP